MNCKLRDHKRAKERTLQRVWTKIILMFVGKENNKLNDPAAYKDGKM